MAAARAGARAAAGAVAGFVLASAQARAQCVPPPGSNEAKLLAFYEAPVAFATVMPPEILSPGHFAITGELTGVPAPANALLQTGYCYPAKQEGTHVAPILPRLRLELGLPVGFAVEGSYEPQITVDRAKPNFGSLAVSYTRQLLAPLSDEDQRRPGVLLQFRVHGTTGSIHAPITCPKAALQLTDPAAACYGTMPSNDIFYPRSIGTEAVVAARPLFTRLSADAGLGYLWLDPRFRVGFTNATGFTDHTRVEVGLRRAAIFGGVSVRVVGPLDAGAEVYSVPADLTTWRIAARYRI
jgi:hypothetical protein